MKNTLKKCLVLLLAAAMLLPLALLASAKNGPSPEHYEDWYYARLEFIELDGSGEPVMVDMGGWTEQKTLPLYAKGKAVAQTGAVYDPASNTLTLTDLNKSNYALRVNLMGDDFTLCVKGSCALAYIDVYGGGVMQPKWGGSLKITGDGALTVNENKKSGYGIIFYAQEEDAVSFTVDQNVTLSVSGAETAVEVYGYTGKFTMTAAGKAVALTKQAAVRTVSVYIDVYSNVSMKHNIHLCRNAADPEGLYGMDVWMNENEEVTNVTVDRYLYLPDHAVYVVDHAWAKEHGGEREEVSFPTLKAANDAGFTHITDGEGNDTWKTVICMENYGSRPVYTDKAGNRYVVELEYNGEDYVYVPKKVIEIKEIPGAYLAVAAPGVSRDDVTEVEEDTVMEGLYDYVYPGKTFTAQPGAGGFKPGDVDNNGKVDTSDARLALRQAIGLEHYADGSREFRACDVDASGKVETKDARYILRHSIGLPDAEIAW